MRAVFMPARNEQKHVGKNIDALKDCVQHRKIDNAVIVIDGSTDRTPEIIFSKLGLNSEQIKKLTARERNTLVLSNGFIIIWHKHPEGKGRCFMESIFTLKGRTLFFKNPDSVLVNIDADAINLKEKIIAGIIKEITKRKAPMLLGKHLEIRNEFAALDKKDRQEARTESTGFRALKADALEPMLKFDEDWIRTFPRSFGMDYALNLLIYEARHLNQKKPGRFNHDSIPKSRYRLLHGRVGKHDTDYKQHLQRYDARVRFLRDSPAYLNFSGPDNLAFREKAKRRNLR